ncbi:klaroid protein-like [Bacillus rossius redtenbacheri]|uniref:klaroid protein-like n=1 Tax=Bacillus rossius redtenbacheri TaxID=93214 RepID=UPI002FDD525F
MLRTTRSSIVQKSEGSSGSVSVVSKQYSKISSSSVQDTQSMIKNKVDLHEADSALVDSSGYEHDQNVFNTQLSEHSPRMANGQVKQTEERSEAKNDQSWFHVHSNFFRDKFYWNQYEKTDLTYSKLSPYYNMEISPGVPVMPNLSRRPLRSGSVSMQLSPQRGDLRQGSSSHSSHSFTTHSTENTSGYGLGGYSDDEGDVIRRRTVGIHSQQSVSVVTTVYMYIVSVLSSIYTKISQITSTILNRRNVVYGDIYRGRHTPQARSQQSTGSLWWGQRLYRLLCRQLLADSWLLCCFGCSAARVAGGRSGRALFALFFLLPLAFLAGWWTMGAYPEYLALSSKPAELLKTLAQLGNQRSHKEEVRLPLIMSSDNNEKEYSDMEWPGQSLAEQVAALGEQLARQHRELEAALRQRLAEQHRETEAALRGQLADQRLAMEAQREQLRLVEAAVGRLDENWRVSRSEDGSFRSTLQHLQASLQSVAGKVQRLARCCNRPLLIPASVVQGHVLQFLERVFSAQGKQDHADIHAWMRSMFVAKDEVETRLANASAAIQSNVNEELVQSAKIIMESVAERIIQSKLDQHQSVFATAATSSNAAATDVGEDSLTYAQVKQIVQEALSIYDADKTGLVDYALETSGGSVLSTRCTENFNTQFASLYMFNVRWFPWFSVGTSPRMAIQPHMSPGECWAFAGAQGFLVIQLSREIYVSGFTLEHIPKSLVPNGHIDSAPAKFSVWGLENEKDEDPLLLGSYMYMHNSSSLQYFKVQQEETRPFRIVELKVLSNHGHPNYTCIYRFRVHGTPVQK